jgi:hypothetical protein
VRGVWLVLCGWPAGLQNFNCSCTDAHMHILMIWCRTSAAVSYKFCRASRRWTRTLSADPVDGSGAGSGTTSPAAQEAAAEHLLLPCAVVRGALQVIEEDEPPLPISSSWPKSTFCSTS